MRAVYNTAQALSLSGDHFLPTGADLGTGASNAAWDRRVMRRARDVQPGMLVWALDGEALVRALGGACGNCVKASPPFYAGPQMLQLCPGVPAYQHVPFFPGGREGLATAASSLTLTGAIVNPPHGQCQSATVTARTRLSCQSVLRAAQTGAAPRRSAWAT